MAHVQAANSALDSSSAVCSGLSLTREQRRNTPQEVEDLFLKVRASVNLGFVQERHRAAYLNFTGDLLCNPRIA
jgi:hypothetical protein